MNKPNTLQELLTIMQADNNPKYDQWDMLPTFGGDEPRNVSECRSWDDSHVIVGTRASNVRIMTRKVLVLEL